jgi:hypothetical protein
VTAHRGDASDFWCTDNDRQFLHPHSGHLSLFRLAQTTWASRRLKSSRGCGSPGPQWRIVLPGRCR